MNRGLANPVGSSVPYPTSRYAIMYLSLIPTDFQESFFNPRVQDFHFSWKKCVYFQFEGFFCQA